ncbi:40S ribosomal protein S27-like [Daktulosphaira vitifoliae]|uniref:40S ribosomal protein S27-like n=1 Tax=Daktulosphaira vitifoliae TaxID=58002 RepID=UPI0021AA4E17|nr:40S ribosomal protein S27-like [Daktulosphaira vitifoliae]
MPLAKSILHPTVNDDQQCHKLKRLVPRPNSYFMDIKCPGCYKIKTVFSHIQNKVKCDSCMVVLSRPTGGKGKLSDGCSYRRKY